MCGHSFVDGSSARPGRTSAAARERSRPGARSTAAAVVVVATLALLAGLTSFFVSRSIELSRLVTVQAGTIWKCSKCGREYRNRVMTFSVPRSERDRYTVETVEGECYTCRYGEFTGRFADYLERFSREGYFLGYPAEMDAHAAEFMSANQALFPAGSAEAAAAAAADVDPRALERDFPDHAGKPVHLAGRVVSSQVVEVKGSGTRLTYLVIAPRLGGRDLDQGIGVIYPAVSQLMKGDIARCYLLPLDIVRFTADQGEKQMVLTAGIYLTRQAGR